MGKIQLTEGQYDRLKKRLIESYVDKNLISESTLDTDTLDITINKAIKGNEFIVAAPSKFGMTVGGNLKTYNAQVVDSNTYEKSKKTVVIKCSNWDMYIEGNESTSQNVRLLVDNDTLNKMNELCDQKVGPENAAQIQKKAVKCGWGLKWKKYRDSKFHCFTDAELKKAKDCGHFLKGNNFGYKDQGNWEAYSESGWSCKGSTQKSEYEELDNAKWCAWGDDVDEYKNSGYSCPNPNATDKQKKQAEEFKKANPDFQTNFQQNEIDGAKKCGWGTDVAGYVKSVYACPKPGGKISGGKTYSKPKPKPVYKINYADFGL